MAERRYRGVVLAVVVVALLVACAPVRHIADDEPGAPQQAAAGPLAVWLDEVDVAAERGKSGFRLLTDGPAAFDWRVRTARKAAERISIQYFIWEDDAAGRALLGELLAAAERGVEVELLLDDMAIRGDEALFLQLDAHPNADVRAFNPFRTRAGLLRMGGEFVVRAGVLNHRMHNKVWTVDGRVSIVGGRNVSNEYFEAGEVMNFTDLDVVMAGPLALDVDLSFRAYWRSPAAVPLRELAHLADDPPAGGALGSARPPRIGRPAGPGGEGRTCTPGPMEAGAYVWSDAAEVVADDPAKALRGQAAGPGVVEALARRYAAVDDELILISPYFVPGADGIRTLAELSRRGVDVAVLTNSLAATDVALAHGGYARRRHALLDAGVTLHELRPTAWSQAQPADGEPGLGNSRASLHSKAQILDGREVFIGSFNIDPRSANINTELGVFIAEAAIVEQVHALYRGSIDPATAYRVERTDGGLLQWVEDRGNVHELEPKAGLWRRVAAWIARILPIESQL